MTKAQAVILHIVKRLGTPVHSTALVKLTYLADYLYSENFGANLTGFEYMWDHFGPNAVGHAIISEAQKLAQEGELRSFQEPNIYGTFSQKFRLPDDAELPPLEPDEEMVVADVIAKFGGLTLTSLVAASKRTAPFQTARQYERLVLPRMRRVETTTGEDAAAFRQSLDRYGTQSLDDVRSELGLAN